jgi:hypothetical protein
VITASPSGWTSARKVGGESTPCADWLAFRIRKLRFSRAIEAREINVYADSEESPFWRVYRRTIFPEFIQLYQKDDNGHVKDEYEPLRVAVQLYEQGYAISYWKAGHTFGGLPSKPFMEITKTLLWQETTPCFGNQDLVVGMCPAKWAIPVGRVG